MKEGTAKLFTCLFFVFCSVISFIYNNILLTIVYVLIAVMYAVVAGHLFRYHDGGDEL